jgi:hypothetical protein
MVAASTTAILNDIDLSNCFRHPIRRISDQNPQTGGLPMNY